MPDQRKIPASRRLQAAIFRAVNIPMRALLALPFPTPPGRSLMLLSLRGRKTGRTYRQPVSYVRDGGTLLTPGGGRWKRNLVPGAPVTIRLRGTDIQARPEILGDPAEVDRLLGLMAEGNPMVKRFVGVPQGEDGHFDSDRLRIAVDHGFRVVRWHPETALR
jgi:F420H(2)-dependent quinone reductase